MRFRRFRRFRLGAGTLAVVLAAAVAAGGAERAPLGEGGAGIAARYPGDRGIERDPAVLFASGFENGFEGWTHHNPKVSTIVNDPALAHGGRAVLQTTATRGQNSGGDVTYTLPRGVDRLYLRFYTKFHEETCMPHHFVKIRAFAPNFRIGGHAGRRPRGDQAFWTGIEPLRDRTWNFYTYWHEMRSYENPDGSGTRAYGNMFHPGGQTPFETGEWICVEAMMKANTVGRHDGEKAFWINGTKIGHWRTGEPEGRWLRDKFFTHGPYFRDPKPFEGFNFRTSDEVKIRQIALQWYLSAEHMARHATVDENIVYFDDVVVATSYVGPRAAP
jgi:hypothetical protein